MKQDQFTAKRVWGTLTQRLSAYVGDGYTLHLAGWNVHYDRAVLMRDAPVAAALCSHRLVDVSSIHQTMRHLLPDVAKAMRGARPTHRAMADVEQAIDAMRVFQRWVDALLAAQPVLEGVASGIAYGGAGDIAAAAPELEAFVQAPTTPQQLESLLPDEGCRSTCAQCGLTTSSLLGWSSYGGKDFCPACKNNPPGGMQEL